MKNTIPNNWIYTTLGLVSDISIGGTPSRSNPAYWDVSKHSNNLWVSIKDLSNPVINETEEYITDIGVKRSNAKKVIKGTVLMSFKLTIGRVAKAGRDLYTNEAIAAIKPNKELNNNYLYFGLQHWNLLNNVDQAIKGATLNKEKLNAIEIYFPKITKEQEKIAEILSIIDDGITETDKLIAKYKSIKQGLMQDLFRYGIDENGQIRSQKTHKFKDSPLGRIPEEWQIKNINDISEYVGSGITPKGGQEVYISEGITFIRSQNVHFQKLILEDVAYIDSKIHRRMKRSEVFAYDVLLNITGASIGRCCVVPENLGPANVNQHVCAIRLQNKTFYKAMFLSYFLSSYIGQNQIEVLNAGSNRQGLNYQQIRAIQLLWPEDKEIEQIASMLQAIEELIDKEISHKSKLENTKQGLMNDLLTGKVRVNKLRN